MIESCTVKTHETESKNKNLTQVVVFLYGQACRTSFVRGKVYVSTVSRDLRNTEMACKELYINSNDS